MDSIITCTLKPELDFTLKLQTPHGSTSLLDEPSFVMPPLTITLIRMEVASSRPDHPPTLSAGKTCELSLLVKSLFGGSAADVGNVTPTFFFSVPAISKLTTLTVESLWTAPT